MRIAIYHNLSPGGALRALSELAGRLSLNCEIDLYEGAEAARARRTSPMGPLLSEARHREYTFPIPPTRYVRLPLGYGHEVRRMVQLGKRDRVIADAINHRDYDLVMVNPCGVRFTPAILKYLEGRVVYYMQEPRRSSFEFPMRERRRSALRPGPRWQRAVDGPSWALAQQALARADMAAASSAMGTYVLCNSYFSAERILTAYGIRAHVSYLGVDVDRFCPAGAGPLPPRPFVLSVGRISPTKGHLDVITAVARLPADQRPGVHLVGSGSFDGSFATTLRQAAAEGGVDLEVVHDTSDGRLVAEYRAASVTVCAAELEPFGLTSLESLACGTPVVAIRQGGFREVINDGVNGYLVEPSIEGLADGIARAVGSPTAYSAEQLRSWVIDGRWTWDEAALRLRSHFDIAMAAPPA